MDNSYNQWRAIVTNDSWVEIRNADGSMQVGEYHLAERAVAEWVVQRLNYAANAEARFAQVGAAYPATESQTLAPLDGTQQQDLF